MDFQQWYAWSKSVSLVIFFVLFVAILAWVYWPGKKKGYDEAARKIFDEEER